MFGSPESDYLSELSESEDDSIPEPVRMRARKAQEREKEKSLKSGKKTGVHDMNSNDAPPPTTSARKSKATEGSPPLGRRRSPRLSQIAAIAEDAPMIDDHVPMSPPRYPSVIPPDPPAPTAANKKPRPRPKGKTAAASRGVEVATNNQSVLPKETKTGKKTMNAPSSVFDASPPGANKTPAQTKPTTASIQAPAAPKKKAKPSPPQPSAKSTVEPKARPTRASAAAASKKIAHDAEELNKSTQESSSPNGEAHGSSSTAVEGKAFLCSCVLSCLLSCRSSCT